MNKKHDEDGVAAVPAAEQAPLAAAAAAAAPYAGASQSRPLPAWEQPENPGKRFSIRTPNRGFNDTRAGLKFTEGIAYTDDEEAAAACASFGYDVTDKRKKR